MKKTVVLKFLSRILWFVASGWKQANAKIAFEKFNSDNIRSGNTDLKKKKKNIIFPG